MSSGSSSSKFFQVPFFSIRNISSPEDTANDRTVHAGQIPVDAVIGFPTDENVRGYLVDAEGKKRKASTQVHRAIKETLKERPDVFSVLNGGIVLVAKRVEIEEKTKMLKLYSPSIINGSQTQGVIRDFLKQYPDVPKPHVKFELIVTDDENLTADISIARNLQNNVALLSVTGRRGYLDELDTRVQAATPFRLQKSETQLPADDNEIYSTEKLLQVIAALLPAELWWKTGEVSKVYTYSAKAICLKDFETIYKAAKTPEASLEDPQKLKEVYQFYLDSAVQAIELYDKWKSHKGFKGTGIRSIERDRDEIVDVPDGIIFPILASLSEFAVRTSDGWQINPPSALNENELIHAAKSAYQEIARSKPEIMGKSKACYSQIQQITAIYKKLFT